MAPRLRSRLVHRSVAGSLAAGLVAGLVGTAPPAVAAGVRYASPAGTDAHDCLTPATACSLTKAVNQATAGDEVVVAAGSYTVTASLENNAGISVHGTPGQPRPVITTSANYGLRLQSNGSRAADLTIVHTGNGRAIDVVSSEDVERLDVRTTGPVACFVGPNVRLRDSLCVSTGTSGAGMATDATSAQTPTLRLRNVTAVSTGPSGAGILAALGQSGTLTVELRNVIASGATDIVRQPGGAATVDVTASFSSFDTVGGSGSGVATSPGSLSNQTAAPVFTDTVSYRQDPTSPTIDKGIADAYTGTADLDGDARQLGGRPDIGADEYVPPPPESTPPDTTPPDTAWSKRPKKRTFSHRARFVFTATDLSVTFTCKLDKKRAKTCTSPFRKRIKRHGKHTFRVWATDAAGNPDPTPARYTWRIKRRPGE